MDSIFFNKNQTLTNINRKIKLQINDPNIHFEQAISGKLRLELELDPPPETNKAPQVLLYGAISINPTKLVTCRIQLLLNKISQKIPRPPYIYMCVCESAKVYITQLLIARPLVTLQNFVIYDL